MENQTKQIMEQMIPQTEKYPNRFKPGQSGNPAGRPKLTAEAREALEQIKTLTPLAYKEMRRILESKTASLYAKIQVINIVLDRTYGRPESSVQITNSSQSMEASLAHIQALVAQVKIVAEGDDEYEEKPPEEDRLGSEGGRVE